MKKIMLLLTSLLMLIQFNTRTIGADSSRVSLRRHNFSFTDFVTEETVEFSGKCFCITNGKQDNTYTGQVQCAGNTYNVVEGMLV